VGGGGGDTRPDEAHFYGLAAQIIAGEEGADAVLEAPFHRRVQVAGGAAVVPPDGPGAGLGVIGAHRQTVIGAVGLQIRLLATEPEDQKRESYRYGTSKRGCHIVAFQSLEASLYGLNHTFTTIAGTISIFAGESVCEFGADHKAIALACNELTEKALAHSAGIDFVGSIYVISASFDKRVEDLLTLFFVCAPSQTVAECHRSKSQFGDPQSTVSQ